MVVLHKLIKDRKHKANFWSFFTAQTNKENTQEVNSASYFVSRWISAGEMTSYLQ